MSRYIDADNILYKDLSEGRGACWVTFRDWIKEMPTADVVEVVRCKRCKKYNTDDCIMIHGKKMNRNIFGNDYCSYGERADT